MRDQFMSDDKENLSPNIPRKSGVDKKVLQNSFSKIKENSGLVTPLKVSPIITTLLTH